jgi:hypothetical protein
MKGSFEEHVVPDAIDSVSRLATGYVVSNEARLRFASSGVAIPAAAVTSELQAQGRLNGKPDYSARIVEDLTKDGWGSTLGSAGTYAWRSCFDDPLSPSPLCAWQRRRFRTPLIGR